MLKSIAFHTLSILLSLSIFAPSLVTLFDLKGEVAIVFEMGEEDKGKNDPVKEIDKKELFMASYIQKFHGADSDNDAENAYCIPKIQENDMQVALPPPEGPVSPRLS